MKSLITVILLFMLALLGRETTHFSMKPTAEVGTSMLAYTDDKQDHSISQDAIVPVSRDKAWGDVEFSDIHTLAHRVSTSAERLYRFSSGETFQFIKALLHRMALRVTVLANTSICLNNTSSLQVGEDVSAYYVFGMRHILI